MEEEPPIMNVAVFGLGRIGKIHLSNLLRNQRAIVKYIVECDVETAQAFLKSQRIRSNCEVIPYNSANTVYADLSVKAIFVCTPTYTHEEIVLNGIGNAKAVFCEKPIASSIESTEKCYAEAKRKGVPLFCSFQRNGCLTRRFDPSLRALRDNLDSVRPLQVIKSCSRDNPLPSMEYLKISGGIFADMAVHDIDTLCWLLGEFPSQVFALGTANFADVAAMGDLDTVTVSMRFASGVLALIDVARLAVYGYDQRVEVFGLNGMLSSGDQPMNGFISANKSGILTSPLKHSFPERYEQAYVESLNAFLDEVEGVPTGLGTSSVPADQVLRVIRVCSACHISARTGLPVNLHPNSSELLN